MESVNEELHCMDHDVQQFDSESKHANTAQHILRYEPNHRWNHDILDKRLIQYEKSLLRV